ncbi:MAG: prepilin-type N-terminal cleavage/methylation domain-containing protein [Methylococcales symbiont of Hymedesmia sp. n. MRB-2018]|nr:MAG: prepilin-type N-terminal cleavage/methylation domain-containing protein [Methylococcales symbiont of Hymedesmia sp. n. MRB-2018]KAF3983327.1 MAG: prepilin-type N-terminal cleavage/methylation domain-containing protein [Methylococcales symbiont of Hymedesmia sp. n. MRB-2018]
MRNLKHRHYGFTLIELMIVITIIGIVASIAYPSYTEYVTRAKRGDAKFSLLALQLAQEKYRAGHPIYGSTLEQLGLNSISNGGSYTIAITGSSATEYDATATPLAPHADTICGTLAIDAANNKTATGDDVLCWAK